MRTSIAAIGLAVGVGIGFVVEPAHACLWDSDTLKEEALRQPEVAATVGGDLGKHSEAYYQAKIAYTQRILDEGGIRATAERYDDLAVALAKVGRLDEALNVLDAKDRQFPAQYTTLANRGTFLVHKGDLAGGFAELQKAVTQNPNAHFGREKYQLAIIEYLQGVAVDPTLASRRTFFAVDVGGANNLVAFHAAIQRHGKRARDMPLEPVLALVGIIRFGEGQDNAHVWWGLGWGLTQQGEMQLAARAFRRAELLGHPRARRDGMVAVSVLPGAKHGCCPFEPDQPTPAYVEQWEAFAKKADAEWAKGQKMMVKRQAVEDAKLVRHPKRVFGY